MKKISLVELSQMEVKPKKVKYFNNVYKFNKYNNYENINNSTDLLSRNFNFREFNVLCIEIEEEPFLSDEEIKILKMIIDTSLNTIEEIEKDNDNSLSLISILGRYDCTHEFKDNYFKNLKLKKKYTLEELGL